MEIIQVVEIDSELWMVFPDSILESLNIKEGDFINITVSEGKLYLSPSTSAWNKLGKPQHFRTSDSKSSEEL